MNTCGAVFCSSGMFRSLWCFLPHHHVPKRGMVVKVVTEVAFDFFLLLCLVSLLKETIEHHRNSGSSSWKGVGTISLVWPLCSLPKQSLLPNYAAAAGIAWGEGISTAVLNCREMHGDAPVPLFFQLYFMGMSSLSVRNWGLSYQEFCCFKTDGGVTGVAGAFMGTPEQWLMA